MAPRIAEEGTRTSLKELANLVFGDSNTETPYAENATSRAYETTSSDLLNLNMTSYPTSLPEEGTSTVQASDTLTRLHEFQIIKAVVLAAVTVVILISVCKMVFQLFVKYAVKQEK